MPHVLSDLSVNSSLLRNEAIPTRSRTIREALEDVPRVAALFTTPLGMRIDEGLGGTPAKLSIRVFGPELPELGRIAQQIATIAAQVNGIADLRVEQASGVPQLQVRLIAWQRHGWD